MHTLEEVHHFYHQVHLESPDSLVWSFLNSLGIDVDEATLQLSLGYADRSINGMLNNRSCSEGKQQRSDLRDIGVLRDTGFETLTGITIPFYQDAEVVNLSSFCVGQKHRGMTHTLNTKGYIKVGSSSVGVLVKDPIDVVVLVGMGIHQHFSICCIPEGGDMELLVGQIDELMTYEDNVTTIPSKVYTVPVGGSFLEWLKRKSINALDVMEVIKSSVSPAPDTTDASEGDEDVRYDGTHYYKSFENHHFRITGLERNQGFHSFKITLKVWQDDCYFIDTLDLVSHKQRSKYVSLASEDLQLNEPLLKKDLGKLLLLVEQLQEKRLSDAQVEPAVELSANEIKEATDYLKQPDLIDAIQRDFDSCGVVGEVVNRLVGYLCCTSRLLPKPLSVVVQSSSAGGKTTLLKSVLKMFPEEEQLNYSSLTSQSLYYLGDTNIDGKVVSIAEEEGASRASYALKLLLSEGELSIATTGKDLETGATTTMSYKVTGRVMLFMTTTALDVDEELLNRCILISVDEGSQQSVRIHKQQRHARTLQGYIQKKESKKIHKLHHNIQRVLKPYLVFNPFIDDLTFSCVSTRTRRDHEKYLNLIEVITLLHQYQRKVVKKEYGDEVIEALVVDKKDVELANTIAPIIFATTLDDLPAHTRKVFDKIKTYVEQVESKDRQPWHRVTFTRRKVRELTGLSVTASKTHLNRLVEAECIDSVSGDEGSRFTYQLLVCPSEEEEFDIFN